MPQTIQSISFQENKISLVQAEVDDHNITIQKAQNSSLPLGINLRNVENPELVAATSNHFISLTEELGLNTEHVRFLLPANFLLIKKVFVDSSVPEEKYGDFVKGEISQVLTHSTEDYLIYMPEYHNENNDLKELLVVVFKKAFRNFFLQVAEKANFHLENISVSCFTVDELFRKFFTNQMGKHLLVNFSEYGYHLIISDEKKFLNTLFKPYSKALQKVNRLNDEEILNSFDTMLKEIQSPAPLDQPLHSISQIFLFGSYFKEHWLEPIQSRSAIPAQLLNPVETSEWRIVLQQDVISPADAYRYVEPLSNLLD